MYAPLANKKRSLFSGCGNWRRSGTGPGVLDICVEHRKSADQSDNRVLRFGQPAIVAVRDERAVGAKTFGSSSRN